MLEDFINAFSNFKRNKIRTFLSLLGIIIGVAAVIILVSIVSGYMGEMIKSFEEMGANKISIFARVTATRHVTENDIYGFWDEHPDWISGITPMVSVENHVVKSGNKSAGLLVGAATETSTLKIADGVTFKGTVTGTDSKTKFCKY